MAQFPESTPGSAGSNRLTGSGNAMHDIKEKGREALETAREKGEELLEEGRSRMTKVRDGFETLVVDHPMSAVLIALGVGVGLGLLCPRPK